MKLLNWNDFIVYSPLNKTATFLPLFLPMCQKMPDTDLTISMLLHLLLIEMDQKYDMEQGQGWQGKKLSPGNLKFPTCKFT